MQHHLHPLCTLARWTGAVVLAGIAHGSAWAGYNEGLAAYQAGRHELAFAEFSAAARQGDTRAQRSLGLMYERGHGAPRDTRLAAEWYRRAAEGGHDAARFNLAFAAAQHDVPPAPQTVQIATRP
jgi:TPR repeat protein